MPISNILLTTHPLVRQRFILQATCDNQPVGLQNGLIKHSQMTASSTLSDVTQASNGRLGFKNADSWCAAMDDNNAYLQIDLGVPHVLCAVDTQGNSKADQMVTSYTLQTSLDGKTWTDYKETNQIKIFHGNSDSNSIVKNYFDAGPVCRYVRVLPKAFIGAPCLRMEFYNEVEKTICIKASIGLSNTTKFPDDHFTATSVYGSMKPWHARFNAHGTDGWSIHYPDSNARYGHYLQIKLDHYWIVCAIAIKGGHSFWKRPNKKTRRHHGYVKKFKFGFKSKRRHTWNYVDDLSGPSSRVTTNMVILPKPVITDVVRFTAMSYEGWPVMKVELYGIPDDSGKVYGKNPTGSCNQPLGMASYGIDNSQISVSSETGTEKEKYGKQSARLNSEYAWRSKEKPSKSEYLQVDLGQMKTITGIAIEGDLDKDMRVTSFKFKYSVDNKSWMDYQTFVGSLAMNGRATNWFSHNINARYIRVVPVKWSKLGIAMRIELYGCKPTCDSQPVGLENGLIKHSQMTASSMLSNATKASNGRLGYKSADSWCAAVDDNNAYLQIDLGVPHVLCAVGTQGNSKADQMVTSYTLQTSLDGKTWTDSKEQNQIKIFHGNSDSNSTAKNYLDAGPVCRYVRVLPKAFIGAPCLRVEFYGVERTTCDNAASGIGDPFHTIPDYRMTATTSYSRDYSPKFARTQNLLAWIPSRNDKDDFLQIDLGDPHVLCAVGIQGSGQSYRGVDERTLSYRMSFSMDGEHFTFYPSKSSEITGNKHPDKYYPTVNIAKHTFAKVVIAKFVRIYPVKYMNYKAVRTELYGHKQAWKQPLGLEPDAKIPDKQITASNSLDDKHTATYGRLYGKNAWCGKGNGASHLQIDLGDVKQLVGIAIQGDKTELKWVKAFNLEYGFLTNDMKIIKNIPTHLSKEKETHAYWLPSPVGARYVRVTPTKWAGHACMRIDLYGNQRAPPTKIVSSEKVGNLIAQPGSFVTVKCTASGDNAVKIKWRLEGRDVTKKSRGNTYVREKTASQLQVNFTSVSDVRSNYKCEEVESFRLRCKTIVSCQAVRENDGGDRKDHVIGVSIDLPKPTTIPTTVPTTEPTTLPTTNPPTETKTELPTPPPTEEPTELERSKVKQKHVTRTHSDHSHKVVKKPKAKVQWNPLKPEFWRIFHKSAAPTTSGTWVLVVSVAIGTLGMFLSRVGLY